MLNFTLKFDVLNSSIDLMLVEDNPLKEYEPC